MHAPVPPGAAQLVRRHRDGRKARRRLGLDPAETGLHLAGGERAQADIVDQHDSLTCVERARPRRPPSARRRPSRRPRPRSRCRGPRTGPGRPRAAPRKSSEPPWYIKRHLVLFRRGLEPEHLLHQVAVAVKRRRVEPLVGPRQGGSQPRRVEVEGVAAPAGLERCCQLAQRRPARRPVVERMLQRIHDRLRRSGSLQVTRDDDQAAVAAPVDQRAELHDPSVPTGRHPTRSHPSSRPSLGTASRGGKSFRAMACHARDSWFALTLALPSARGPRHAFPPAGPQPARRAACAARREEHHAGRQTAAPDPVRHERCARAAAAVFRRRPAGAGRPPDGADAARREPDRAGSRDTDQGQDHDRDPPWLRPGHLGTPLLPDDVRLLRDGPDARRRAARRDARAERDLRDPVEQCRGPHSATSIGPTST